MIWSINLEIDKYNWKEIDKSTSASVALDKSKMTSSEKIKFAKEWMKFFTDITES